MTPTDTKRRRLAAAAAASALLLTAACGSDDGSGTDDAGDAPASWPVATVSGEMGEEPVISLESDAETSDETVVEAVETGSGPEVGEGDYIRASVLVQAPGEDNEALIDTWNPVNQEPGEDEPEDGAEEPEDEGSEDDEAAEDEAAEDGSADAEPLYAPIRVGQDEIVPGAITEHLIGHTEGSRVVVQELGSELFGPQITDLGLAEDDTMVFVFDLVTVIDAQGYAEGEQESPADGMPEVSAEGPEAAEITVPEGEDPPEELREQVLIEGEGEEVPAGRQLIVQYTGVKWSDGEIFDSSWNAGSAANFPIGMGQVISGWDETLVGKNVGDRVLLVLPPDDAYGANEGNELQEETLVFVVDILEAI